MSLNKTPRSSRVHIALFGNRNAGKSSIINAITNQDIALVSSVKGTTTDPVYKTMELLPIGPVVFIDTAGLDDTGELGGLRKEKTMNVLNKSDVALMIIDGTVGITEEDRQTIDKIKKYDIPLMGVVNKIDLNSDYKDMVDKLSQDLGIPFIFTSAYTNENIDKLKKFIIKNIPQDDQKPLVSDLISPGEQIVLVIPIDSAAPKGRLILPQQQTIRDILDSDAVSIMAKEDQLSDTISSMKTKPSMVITDSQAFGQVAQDTPEDIALTSFSILFARNKGDLVEFVKGAKALDQLQENDSVLVAEACTHHRQPDDIGRYKIPKWVEEFTGKNINFEFCTGTHFPEDLDKYSLIIHCGACMLNRRAVLYRISQAQEKGIPIVNYGVLIAQVHGILQRALDPFKEAKQILTGGNS